MLRIILLLIFVGFSFEIDPCQRQPFYSTCHAFQEHSGKPYRSQVVVRYFRLGDECVAYPYGLCKSDTAAAKLFRYQSQCEKSCPKENYNATREAVPGPPPVQFIAESTGIQVDSNDEILGNSTNETSSQEQNVIKSGICPFPEIGEYAVCVRECHLDYECPKTLKCCYNGCGRLCLEPKPIENNPCDHPKDHGGCYGYFKRWWYDAGINACKQFIYGGCGGTGNNFFTEVDCNSKCQKPGLSSNASTNVPPAEHWSQSSLTLEASTDATLTTLRPETTPEKETATSAGQPDQQPTTQATDAGHSDQETTIESSTEQSSVKPADPTPSALGQGVIDLINEYINPHTSPLLGSTASPNSSEKTPRPTPSTRAPALPPPSKQIRCPHNLNPLRGSNGLFRNCLPSNPDYSCPNGSMCYFNGVNYHCCPDMELLYGDKDAKVPRGNLLLEDVLKGQEQGDELPEYLFEGSLLHEVEKSKDAKFEHKTNENVELNESGWNKISKKRA